EPRRRSTTWGRGAPSPADPRDERARVVLLRVAHDRDAPAVGAHDVALGNRLGRVVGALAVHVGLEREQQAADVVLVEYDHVVDGAQRADEQRAIAGGQQRTVLAL